MKTHLLVASAILALAVLCSPVQVVAACDPATRAVQYLASTQLPDGSIDGNVNETADYVLGAAASGIDPTQLRSRSGNSPLDFFAADLTGARKSLKDANVLGKLIQAVVAAHRAPRAFGGLDLLSTLRNGATSGGSPAPYYDNSSGFFLDAISGGQNQAFAQANAILGLAAAADPAFKVPGPAVSGLVSLRSTAGTNRGAWSSFGTFDTNDTSMALMALVAAGATPATNPGVFSDALAYLATQADPARGGFTFSTSFATASDPDSDGLVIQALTAVGQDPAGAAWTISGKNALEDILTFQDSSSGGLSFAQGGQIQAFATTQAVAGLRRAPFPIPGVFSAGAPLPPGGCPAPVGAVQASSKVSTPPRLPATGRRAWPPAAPRSAAWLPGLAVLAAWTMRLRTNDKRAATPGASRR